MYRWECLKRWKERRNDGGVVVIWEDAAYRARSLGVGGGSTFYGTKNPQMAHERGG